MQPTAPSNVNLRAINGAVQDEEIRDQSVENFIEVDVVGNCAQVEEEAAEEIQSHNNENELQEAPRIVRNILGDPQSRIAFSKMRIVRTELLGIPRSAIKARVLKTALMKQGLKWKIYNDDEKTTIFEINGFAALRHKFVIKDKVIIKEEVENAVAEAFARGGAITISADASDPLGFGGRGPHLTYKCFLKRRLKRAAQFLPLGRAKKEILEIALIKVNLKMTLEITRLEMEKKRVELRAGGLVLALKYLERGQCLEHRTERAIKKMVAQIGEAIRKDKIGLRQRSGMPIELKLA